MASDSERNRLDLTKQAPSILECKQSASGSSMADAKATIEERIKDSKFAGKLKLGETKWLFRDFRVKTSMGLGAGGGLEHLSFAKARYI